MGYFPETLNGVLRVLCELRRLLWFFAPILAVDNLAPFVWGALYLCRHDDQPTPLFCRLLPCLCVAHNMMSPELPLRRFAQSARKHRIGKASARHVMDTYEPTRFTDEGTLKLLWVGNDERGRELEVIAVDQETNILVIHVMPTDFKYRKRRNEA